LCIELFSARKYQLSAKLNDDVVNGVLLPSIALKFGLPSWILYQDIQLLWDSGLVRGESGYSL
jgi:hypothetical protein